MDKIKKRRIWIVITSIVLILSLANLFATYLGFYESFPEISDFLSSTLIIQNKQFPMTNIVLASSLLLILISAIILLISLIKQKKHKILQKAYLDIKEKHGKFNTDLDALYSLILNNKKMKLSEISKAFNLEDEKSLEWLKILENKDRKSVV